MGRLGLLPRVLWPHAPLMPAWLSYGTGAPQAAGPDRPPDAIMRPGMPPLPWLGGWVPGTVPIGTSVRWLFESAQPLAQMLFLAGYRITDAYLRRGSEWLHFEADDRYVDNVGVETVAIVESEAIFRVESLPYTVGSAGGPPVGINLTLPEGSALAGGSSWLRVDVSGSEHAAAVGSVIESWAAAAADAVAEQLLDAYEDTLPLDGVLPVLWTAPTFDDIVPPDEAQVLTEAFYDVVNVYGRNPHIEPRPSPLTRGQLAELLHDERSDTVVPMRERLLWYFSPAECGSYMPGVQRDQRLRQAARAGGVDPDRESLFTVAGRLHDGGLLDLFGGFAQPATSDWPWVVERITQPASLEPDEVERIAEAIATVPTDEHTAAVLERLRSEYHTTFSVDQGSRSIIRGAMISAIGAAPIESGPNGNAIQFATVLYSMLEPIEAMLTLTDLDAEIDDTWAQWQVASQGAGSPNLLATAPLVFASARPEIARPIVVAVADRFVEELRDHEANVGLPWSGSADYAAPSSENGGWSTELARATVALWALHRVEGDTELPSGDDMMVICGGSPLERFDTDAYRIAYQQALSDSANAELDETLRVMAALDDYTVAVYAGDEQTCVRTNVHGLNGRLSALMADTSVSSRFQAASQTGVHAAMSEPGLTAEVLVARQVDWCRSALSVGVWVGLGEVEREINRERWRDLLRLIDPLLVRELESGIAHLDTVAGAQGIIESLEPADVDWLLDAYIDIDGVGEVKQVLKLAKGTASMAKTVHLIGLMRAELGTTLAVADGWQRSANAAWMFQPTLRAAERAGLSTAALDDLALFRNDWKAKVLTATPSGATNLFDAAPRVVSAAVAAVAALQLLGRAEDAWWRDLSTAELVGAVGEFRDVLTGGLDAIVLAKTPITWIAEWLGGRSASWTRSFLANASTIGEVFSVLSYLVSAGIYAYKAVDAYGDGEIGSAVVYAGASAASMYCAFLVIAGSTGPAVVLGLATVAVVTAHMYIRDWWRDRVEQQEYESMMSNHALLLAPEVRIVSPIDATLTAVASLEPGDLVSPSTELVTLTNSNSVVLVSVTGVWGELDGVEGAVETEPIAFDVSERAGTYDWVYGVPFAGRVVAPEHGAAGSAIARGDTIVRVRPECEVWYSLGPGTTYATVEVDLGTDVAAGTLLGTTEDGDEITAMRAGRVYMIDLGGEDGLDPEPSRIRVRSAR